MNPRTLPKTRRAFRIGDPEGRFPIWSDGGARLFGGRWHLAGDPVIYAAEHYAGAMLEKLAHFNGVLPGRQHYIEITLPAGLSYEVFADHLAPGWRDLAAGEGARFGHDWARERRSAVLFVPSAIAPFEQNLLVNTAHPEFARIETGLEVPIHWDARLFGG